MSYLIPVYEFVRWCHPLGASLALEAEQHRRGTARLAVGASGMVDYSKWDHFDAGDDEDDEARPSVRCPYEDVDDDDDDDEGEEEEGEEEEEEGEEEEGEEEEGEEEEGEEEEGDLKR